VNGPNATYAPPSVRSARSLSWIGPAIVILFTVVLMAAAAHLVREPETVAKVQIVNPVADAVDVDVMQPGGPWLPLAIVEPQSTATAYDVVDDGGPWIVRYKVSGEVLTTVRISHERLARTNWRLTVPTLVD
jgi:hypothetical protein